MAWLKEKKPVANLKILIIGDYGTGKSVFASTCPEPIYLADSDRGAIGYSGKQVYVPDFLLDAKKREGQKLDLLYKDLDTLAKKGGSLSIEGQDVKFKTVVLDSLTTLTKMAMAKAVELHPVAPNSPLLWNVHYPLAKVFLDKIFDRLVRIPALIIAIAHVDYKKDEATGQIKALPAVTGNLKTYLPALFDEVWFASVSQGKKGTAYQLRLAPKGFQLARSRLRSVIDLPESIPNNWQVVEAAIKKAGYV